MCNLGIQIVELSECEPPTWWGTIDYYCLEAQPQSVSATSKILGFDDYFENFCSHMYKDHSMIHAHRQTTMLGLQQIYLVLMELLTSFRSCNIGCTHLNFIHHLTDWQLQHSIATSEFPF